MREKIEKSRRSIPYPGRLLAATVFAALLLSATGNALAKTDVGPKQPLLQADRLSYDEKTGIVTATGNVEVAMGDQILRADKITYNKNTDVARAAGSIVLTQASGEILYAKEAEVTADLKEAFLSRVRILFPDNSRLVAKDAQRFEGRYLVTARAVYTACNLCAADPTAAPLWQVKGVRVTHDAQDKMVIYRDATIEFDGIPVFYTPYFAHPDATVKRKQGFLAPYVGGSKALGMMATVPYYIDFAPHTDLILTPTFSEKDTAQLATDWRYRFRNGHMRWQGSFAYTDFISAAGRDKGKEWRGHLFGETQFDLTDNWRAGTNVAFASDKSYLPRYKITAEDILLNRAYAEYFGGRNYAVGNMYYFQDLRPGEQQKEPFIAPEIRLSALGEPNETFGGRWSFGSSVLASLREKDANKAIQGPNTRRLSVESGWERQLISETGFLTSLSMQARADGYWADNVRREDGSDNVAEIKRTRPFAQANVTIRYPFGRRGDGYQQILEPIALLSVAPNLKRSSLYPNEDSLDVEFDETNLFSTNRFTGVDRLEGGTRMAYGVRNTYINDNGGKVEMLGGQIFRAKKNQTFPDGSGLTDRLSDYVGRIGVSPSSLFDANYGFRLAQEDLSFRRQQITTSMGRPIFRPSLRYLYSQETEASANDILKLEEGMLGFSSSFAQYWTISASHTHAFRPNPGARNTLVGVTYKDECFEATLSGARDYTTREDLESGTTVYFRFFMKNIGGWGSD